jgi:hypothetical protein
MTSNAQTAPGESAPSLQGSALHAHQAAIADAHIWRAPGQQATKLAGGDQGMSS